MVSTEDLFLFRAQARLILGLAAIVWAIHLVNVILGYGLNYWFGIRPRSLWGSVGIVCSHFLHADWDHLIGNTKGFLLLGWFIAAQGIHLFYAVTIIIALLGGLLTWLIQDKGYSIGASIVIYGYMGFLLIYGLTANDGVALLFAVITGLEYRYNLLGNIVTFIFVKNRKIQRIERDVWHVGWLPTGDPDIDAKFSWSGHFSGLLAGIFAGYLMAVMKLSV